MISEYAIRVENLSRGYDSCKVLDNLNINIKEGTICALLGASGSGKTTIIKTLLGRLCQDEGKVLIFNREPFSSIDFDYPGSLVGYAPQETALYEELTIGEILKFYGNIHSLDKNTFKQNRDSIISLLGLPDKNKKIETLSGGQKRRVSLAIALIHKPKILYLDEPTVGIDPLISKRIWNHLIYLSKEENVTILITTHYIEETRHADNILFLRDHKIIEKGNPFELLDKYKCTLLEDVYLKVCTNQNNDPFEIETSNENGGDSLNNEISKKENQVELSTQPNIFQYIINTIFLYANIHLIKKKMNHSFSICKRLLIQCVRVKIVFVSIILSPALLCSLFFITIGGPPHDVPLGLCNKDMGYFGESLINELYNKTTFSIFNISDTDIGIKSVIDGSIYGYIEIPSNFSAGIANKYLYPNDPPLPNSEVIPYLDESNSQISLIILSTLQEIFVKLSNESGIKLYPITETVSIYEGDNNYRWFLGPAILPIMIFSHIMFFIEVGLIKERNSGCLDRLFGFGITPLTNTIGWVMCICFLLFIQNSLLLIIGHFAFGIPIKDNIVLVYLFLYLVELIGVYYGVIVYTLVKEQVEAVQISMALFFTVFFISGSIWPVESIPKWFQWSSYATPTTWAWIAIRGLLIKGLPFTHQQIWKPFLILISWDVSLFIISVKSVKYRESNNKLLLKLYQFKYKITHK